MALQTIYVLGQSTPDSYYKEAIEYYQKGQFSKTIELCTKAVAIDAKFSKGFRLRGDAKYSSQDLDGAIQDYTKAIELTPRDAEIYVRRGDAFYLKRTPVPAVADYTTAIDLTYYVDWEKVKGSGIPDSVLRALAPPQLAGIYAKRAIAYTIQSKFVEAGRDLDEAVAYAPKVADHYYTRSWARLYLGNGVGAAQDAEMYLKLNGVKGDYSAYAAIAGYLGNMKIGKVESAKNFMNWHERRGLETNEWSKQVIQFLYGKIKADDLIKLAGSGIDKLTEAHAYVGEVYLFESKPKEAARHLGWVRENGNRDFVEYHLAIAELKRIESQ